jgi:hypothetical protein
MEAIRSSETSVLKNHMRHITEDGILYITTFMENLFANTVLMHTIIVVMYWLPCAVYEVYSAYLWLELEILK